uniref:DNA-binding protein n=1 Tax=uncultured Psychrobacter sp. TaxID=259303 RepID=UPI002631721F|nr:DNA-binding protein [uncultured Psychrobacter sp.]
MALTTESIHKKADELLNNGVQPTLARIRESLGGGSFTTISEAMKLWRLEQETEEDLRQVELPSSINDRLQALGADMWRSAIDTAEERLVSERNTLAVAQKKARTEVYEAQEAVKTLELEQTDLLVQLDELSDKARIAKEYSDQVSLQLKKVEASSQKQVDDARKELSDSEHKLEIQRGRIEDSNAIISGLKLDLHEVREKLTSALESTASYKAISDSQSVEIERLKAELTESRKQRTTLQSEREISIQNLSKAEGKLEVLNEQLEKIKSAT